MYNVATTYRSIDKILKYLYYKNMIFAFEDTIYLKQVYCIKTKQIHI